MTQEDLIDHLQWRLFEDHGKEIAKTLIAQVLDVLGKHTRASLVRGGKVPLPGVGMLEAKKRPARKGRNPRTGAAIDIPASRGVQFRPGKVLKDALNGGAS